MVKKKKPKIFLLVRWCFSIGLLSFTQWSIKEKVQDKEKNSYAREERRLKKYIY